MFAFQGYTKDPLGGPAGGTQNAFASIFQGIADYKRKQEEEEKKRRALQGIQEAGMPMDQATIGPSGDMELNTTSPSIENQINAILRDPRIPMDQKIQATRVLSAQAQARQLEKPVQKETKSDVVEWWDASGKGHKTRVPHDQYNQFVQTIEKSGGTVDEPEKPDKPDKPSYDTIWAYKPGDPESWQQVEYKKGTLNETVQKLRRDGFRFRKEPPSGSDKTEYMENVEKLIDDTRAYYQAKAKALIDPMTGTVRDKEEYNNIMKDMQADMVRARKKQVPKWLEEQKNSSDPFDEFLGKYDR